PASATERQGEVADATGARTPGPPAAATQPRGQEAAEETTKSPLPPAGVHRFSARTLVSVDVSGRLLAKDRQVAGPGRVDLGARLGGTQLGRRPDPAVAGGESVERLTPR